MFPKCRLGLGDVCRAAPTLGSESNCRTRSVIPEEERRAGRPPTRAAPKERGRGGWGRKERGRRVKEGLGKGSRTAGSSRKNAPRGQVRDAHPARSRPPLSLRRDARFEAPPLSRLSRNDGKEGEDGGPKRLSQRRPDIPRAATAAVARRPPRAGTPRTTPSARPHYISYASRAAAASSVW